MLLDEAVKIAQEMIGTRSQHCNYARVCHLARQYKALMTGENAEILLKQFIKREDDEAFKQRLALTILITPAIISALMKPFNKVSWNKKVKKFYDLDTVARDTTVETMRNSFYGRSKSKNKGLDYWLKTRFPSLSFVDPNAWVVTEWDAPATQAEIIKPRPFEVTSEMAWEYSVINEEVKWLWVHQDIAFNKLTVIRGQKIQDARDAGIYTPEAGDKWTLYDEDYTLVYTEVDPNYMKSTGYKTAANEDYWKDPVSKKTYLVKTTEPKLTVAPAFQVGYIKDVQTDGETFVNSWHEAMPYLMKSVKTVSELDLTMSLHAFPQKMQYVQKCPGTPTNEGKRKGCNYGVDGTGAICTSCKGSGYKIHTSAQDALFFPFPEQGTTNAELLDLEKLLVYKSPPTDLLEFQNKYIDGLKEACHLAVFNKTQLTKKGSGVAGSGPITATEANDNIQAVYDALHPFTEKVSDMWINFIFIFALLAGMKVDADVDITCIYPATPQMKSMDELLADLKTANDSGAPPILIDAINQDIAETLYEGDDVSLTRYQVKHQFFPFNGQTPDEIALAIASQYVSKETKILYSNFEAIFTELDLENPGFWYLDYEEQNTKVDEMVQKFTDEIDATATPDIKLGMPPGFPPLALKPGDPGYVEPTPAA